jgi:hypothetical protein
VVACRSEKKIDQTSIGKHKGINAGTEEVAMETI